MSALDALAPPPLRAEEDLDAPLPVPDDSIPPMQLLDDEAVTPPNKSGHPMSPAPVAPLQDTLQELQHEQDMAAAPFRGDCTPPNMRSFSIDAPAFTPGPHTLTVFCPVDGRSAVLPCDLSTLTVGDLTAHAAALFGLLVHEVDLTFTGMRMSDPMAKTIDIGISNQSVVLIQPKVAGSAVPLPPPPTVCDFPPPPTTFDDQLQMQQHQMMQFQQALQANQAAQMHLAAMAGIPLNPMSPTAPEMPHERDEMMVRPHHAPALPPHHPPQQVVMNPAMLAHPAATPPPRYQCQASPSPGLTSSGPSSGPPTITRVIMVQAPPSPSLQDPPPRPRPAAPRPCGSINLRAISGEFCAYALTNEGSRALVTALDGLAGGDGGDSVVDPILAELPSKLAALATHQHGSKVLRALIRRLSATQAAGLLRIAARDVVELAESTSGSDVLTELVTKAGDSDAALGFCTAMAPGLFNVCCSVNGRKVLLAALQHFGAEAVEPLYDTFGHQLLNVATDQCGCITLQRVLDYTTNVKWKTQLQMQILEAMTYLITDPYGNYVLQHAVKDEQYCSQVVAEKVSGRLLDFACNKFASNVVERCLQIGPDSSRDMLIEEVIQPQVLQALMQDAYGNFVVQSSVDQAPPPLLERLREAVLPLIPRSPYGYRIESKLHRRVKRGGGGRRGSGRGAQQLHASPQTPLLQAPPAQQMMPQALPMSRPPPPPPPSNQQRGALQQGPPTTSHYESQPPTAQQGPPPLRRAEQHAGIPPQQVSPAQQFATRGAAQQGVVPPPLAVLAP